MVRDVITFIPSESMRSYHGTMFVGERWQDRRKKTVISFPVAGDYEVTREKAIQLLTDFPGNFRAERDLLRLERIRVKRSETIYNRDMEARIERVRAQNKRLKLPAPTDEDLLSWLSPTERAQWVLERLGCPTITGRDEISKPSFIPPPDFYDDRHWALSVMDNMT